MNQTPHSLQMLSQPKTHSPMVLSAWDHMSIKAYCEPFSDELSHAIKQMLSNLLKTLLQAGSQTKRWNNPCKLPGFCCYSNGFERRDLVRVCQSSGKEPARMAAIKGDLQGIVRIWKKTSRMRMGNTDVCLQHTSWKDPGCSSCWSSKEF